MVLHRQALLASSSAGAKPRKIDPILINLKGTTTYHCMNRLDLSDPLGVNDPITTVASKEDTSFKIHLRVQQRNARQRTTTLSGLPNDYDLKDFIKKIRKRLCCNGAVVNDKSATDEKFDKVLQFSGDQRQDLANFLVESGIAEKKDITVHGY